MKIDRLISVIMILLEHRRASIPELAEICEVSPRTISRDLETINQAGIPIVSYPGLHGGVGIMESYKMEKRLLSTADVTALLMGLGCIRSSLFGQEVVNAQNFVTVTLRVKTDAVERLEELFGSEIFTAEDGEWRTAQISFTDDARGYRFLLGFGAECVCIAPEDVRKNIAGYLNEVAEMYRSNMYGGLSFENTIIRPL